MTYESNRSREGAMAYASPMRFDEVLEFGLTSDESPTVAIWLVHHSPHQSLCDYAPVPMSVAFCEGVPETLEMVIVRQWDRRQSSQRVPAGSPAIPRHQSSSGSEQAYWRAA